MEIRLIYEMRLLQAPAVLCGNRVLDKRKQRIDSYIYALFCWIVNQLMRLGRLEPDLDRVIRALEST